jgi:hypothetical protein
MLLSVSVYFDCGRVCFISIPISFPYGAVVLFGTSCCDVLHCLFLFPRFLYLMGLSTFRVSMSGFVLCQIATPKNNKEI